jgi:cupin 2 domain-containing protein
MQKGCPPRFQKAKTVKRSAYGSILENLPDSTKQEQLEELCGSRSFRIERIVSAGQLSPPGFWFDQTWDEWVLVVQGAAAVRLQDPEETVHLTAGDWLMIEAHRRHRVEATSPQPVTIWVVVHGCDLPATP